MNKALIQIVNCPLPQLNITEATIIDRISQPYKIVLQGHTQHKVNPQSTLFQPFSLKMNDSQHYHGIATALEITHSATEQQQLTLTLEPTLSLLQRDLVFFQYRHQSVIQIIQSVLQQHHITASFSIKRTLPKLDHVTQYNESSLNFIHRLLDRYGLCYYFTHHEHDHKLIISDSLQRPEPAISLRLHHRLHDNKPQLLSLSDHACVTADSAETLDYHYQQSQQALTMKAPIQRQNSRKKKQFHYPGRLKDKQDSQHQQTIQQQKLLGQRNQYEGSSNASQLQAGNLIHHSSLDKPIVIREILHHVIDHTAGARAHSTGKQAYRNTFKAISSDLHHVPAADWVQPNIHGIQTALVTKPCSQNPAPLTGEVCVQFDWSTQPSQWIRTTHHAASDGQGLQFIPREQDEVAISFQHGDPDEPIIVGQLFNTDHPTPLTAQANTRTGLISRSRIPDNCGHALVFDDEENKEKLFIHSAGDLFTHVGDNQQTLIQNDFHHNIVEGDFTHTTEQGQLTLSAQSIVLVNGSSSIVIDSTGVHFNGANITLQAQNGGPTQPAARKGDYQKCPKYENKVIPHVGGSITSGSDNVTINGQPAARLNEAAKCDPASCQITSGSASVFINGQPAARVKDPTDHGGEITQGSNNVFIGG